MTRYEAGWRRDDGSIGIEKIDRKGTVDHRSPLDLGFETAEEAQAAAEELQAAWQQGNRDAAIEGAESQTVCNPYTDDGDEARYDAWEAGFNSRLDR